VFSRIWRSTAPYEGVGCGYELAGFYFRHTAESFWYMGLLGWSFE